MMFEIFVQFYKHFIITQSLTLAKMSYVAEQLLATIRIFEILFHQKSPSAQFYGGGFCLSHLLHFI